MVMALMASLGLFLLGEPLNLWLAGIILGAILLIIMFRKPLFERTANLRIAQSWGGISLKEILSQATTSQLMLFTPRMLGVNFTFGVSAWMTEVVIYFLSLAAIGVAIDSNLFIVALAIFPLASLGGSLSFLPGGLGVTEGGLAALGILIGDLSEETAILAALLSRAAILGVVVLAGIVALPLLHRIKRGAFD